MPPLPIQVRENDAARENDDRILRSLRVSPSTTRNNDDELLLLLLDENNNNDNDDIYRKKKRKKNDIVLCRWTSTRARDSALEEAPSL
jgi:hypothetical protein